MEKGKMKIRIESVPEPGDGIGLFADRMFEDYALEHGVTCGYEDFCFTAKAGDRIIGLIKGHAYYNEVHIGDLIVSQEYRGIGVGTMLVKAVESAFTEEKWENINLSTYAFQAPEFYGKLGYEVEYVRPNKDERLTKTFFIKRLHRRE